jgi:hypothetical protein
MSSKRATWLRHLSQRLDIDEGLVIIPEFWDEEDRKRQADSEARYAMDPSEVAMLDDFARCRAEGHLEHTCPACGDRSCLRCGVGWNV